MKKNFIKVLAAVGLVSSILTMPFMTFAAQPKIDFIVDIFDSTKTNLISKVKPEVGDEIVFRVTINNTTSDFSNVKIKVVPDSAYMTLIDTAYASGYLFGEIKAKSGIKMVNARAMLKKIGDFKTTVTVSADNATPNSQSLSFNLSGSAPAAKPENNGGGSCEIDGFNTTDSNLCNPLKAGSLSELVKQLVEYILMGITGIALVTIVVSSFRIVISQGNEEAIKGAKNAITWAVVGVILALLAYSIAAIIYSALN